MNRKLTLAAAAAALVFTGAASAQETAIGHKPILENGMIISAAYLGPEHLAMAPMMPGMDAPADIHLETDFHADKNNQQGLQPGAWIPYLNITYFIAKKGSAWHTFGPYMPMVASDGEHYGNNVKLDGPGEYTLELHVEPPPYSSFYRHTDKEIGVAKWWAPFNVSWTFDYPAKTARH